MCSTSAPCKCLLVSPVSANDIAKEKKRTKVTAEDVFTALNELGFGKFEENLKEFIKHYNSDREDLAREQKEKKRVREAEEGEGESEGDKRQREEE